jgi:hypothetical protein
MKASLDIEKVLSLNLEWFKPRTDVLGLLLVGSYARKTAGPDSDIDLVILTETPGFYRKDHTWPEQIAWKTLHVTVSGWRDQDYGRLWSRHVRLSSGLEMEYGFAASDWASVDPLDEGTCRVMRSGHLILYDPKAILAVLSDCVRKQDPSGSKDLLCNKLEKKT